RGARGKGAHRGRRARPRRSRAGPWRRRVRAPRRRLARTRSRSGCGDRRAQAPPGGMDRGAREPGERTGDRGGAALGGHRSRWRAALSTAYAYARTRARRSTLLRPEQLDAFRAASGRAAAVAALRSSGIDARDAAAASRACLLRFVADAERLVASWPHPDLLVAVVGLIEIENLKLGCRAVRTGAAAESWTPLWRPLGKVSRLRIEAFADPPSLRAALEALAPLPWGAAASRALRAHEDDAAAFEIALDTFASRRLLEAEAAAGARRLAASLVRIRDVDAVSRAA